MALDRLDVECLGAPCLSQGLGVFARRVGQCFSRRADLSRERLEPGHLFVRETQRLLPAQENLRVEGRTLPN
jgi:hypothetical protein